MQTTEKLNIDIEKPSFNPLVFTSSGIFQRAKVKKQVEKMAENKEAFASAS